VESLVTQGTRQEHVDRRDFRIDCHGDLPGFRCCSSSLEPGLTLVWDPTRGQVRGPGCAQVRRRRRADVTIGGCRRP
jgi:hypothetical protein